MSGDGDNRDSLQHRVGLDAARGLVAVKARQLNIHENEVRPVGGCCGKPGLTVLSFYDLEIGTCEQVPQDLPIVLLVLDHKDALAHDGPACASTRDLTVGLAPINAIRARHGGLEISYPGGYDIPMENRLVHQSHPEIVKRLRRAEGHLRRV